MVFCPKTFKTEGNTQASQNITLHFQHPNGLQLWKWAGCNCIFIFLSWAASDFIYAFKIVIK